METSLKTGFAQIFSCCPKNLSCPKFGGAAAPLAPPVRTPMCQVIQQGDFHARSEIRAAGLSPLSEGSYSNDCGDGNESGKKQWVCLFCSGGSRGGAPGGRATALFLDQTEARRAKEKFFWNCHTSRFERDVNTRKRFNFRFDFLNLDSVF